jgi:hypothetical protein
MKLLVDSVSRRVVYAEADKDAIDFIFNLLTLPVVTVISRRARDNTVSCDDNLKASVEMLPGRYFCHADASAVKGDLLRPPPSRHSGRFLQLTDASSSSSNERRSFTRRHGFVQGIVTYTVTDDLKVTPMSTISGIAMLNTFGVRC